MTAMMKPHAFKPFMILMATFTLQQATGTYAVVFYAVNVFRVSICYINTLLIRLIQAD